MAFLIKSDIEILLRTYRLNQITDENDVLIETAASMAEAKIIDALYQYYDVTAIFGKTGIDRPQNVLTWSRHLTIYYLYERVPDEQVPERVVFHYKEVCEVLTDIAKGKISVDLPRLETDSDGDGKPDPKTRFKWGSVPKRSH
ncbi:MAG: DUF1320 domain-containing protein [Candidatus Kapaibacterium sp.]|nr:MAG: DUF1320 domain-containing protein [Candidatus Kapabacteria bacterium]